jgi:hypothetical protein
MFSRESVVHSNWYLSRLESYRLAQVEHLSNGLDYVQSFKRTAAAGGQIGVDIATREADIFRELEQVKSKNYTHRLVGTIGK